MGVIDDNITQCFEWTMIQVLGLISRAIVIALFAPVFLLFGCVVGIVGLAVGNLYLKAQLSVKREMRLVCLAHTIRIFADTMQ